MKTGVELIAAERQEQIEKHFRSLNYDVRYNDNGQLEQGALMLLSVDFEEGIDTASYPQGWNEDLCTKMIGKPRRDRLIIAGALIAAEIDRIKQ